VGAARLVPTPRFFPLRLRLLRAAARLAAATRTYVPLAAPLLDMLHWAELSKPPKGAAGSGAGGSGDLSLSLRASKNTLRSAAFQEEVVLQVRSV
jgi:nucleolar complex protein 2